jgi:hypothetical protein
VIQQHAGTKGVSQTSYEIARGKSFSSGATIIFPLANRKLQFRHIRRNHQPESGMSPPDYSYPVDNLSAA